MSFFYRGNLVQVLLALSLLLATATQAAPKATWDNGQSSAEAACRTLYGKEGAYVFHRVEVRDDIAYCYEKVKEGEEKEIKFGSVSRDVVTEEETENAAVASTPSKPSQSEEQHSADEKSTPKNCNYEFRKAEVAQGDDPLSNLLCETASNNSPSFRVYPVKEGKTLAKQLTEVDALRGNTWYECKCGYASTVKDAKAGKQNALARFTGPDGIDKKIRTQVQVAQECGYEYNLVVASEIVENYFRERYTDVKVVREDFEPCEQ